MRNAIIKHIWGLSKELDIDKEDIYAILHKETQKDSMRNCTDSELNKLLDFLILFKESDNLQTQGATKKQLAKIFALAYSLKWDNNPNINITKRINSYCKKVVGVEQTEWLTSRQAYIVIEGLKKIKSKESIK